MAAVTVTGTALPKTPSASSIRSFSGERFSVLIFWKNKRRISLTCSASNNTSSSSSSSSGLYSAQKYELTAANVDMVLEDVRPYLISDGGNVEVVSVEGGECVVKYIGPDSIASGIKAAIKERFPDILNVTFQAWDSHQ
ncbi:nifU-like protein 1, chloroplastic [Arachis ipaensis]|uniref:nifU-like protein 1, chloroplastic n=1 Tax=Arachis ipaensis TaxID=130454 RepID=UPI000A2B03D3|nr:nifU-like protein 1, chloroplastic [Arachis ipaensis]